MIKALPNLSILAAAVVLVGGTLQAMADGHRAARIF